MVDHVGRAVYLADLKAEGYERGAAQVERANEAMVGSHGRAVAAGEKVTNNLIQLARGYDGLERRFVAGARETAAFESAINNLGKAIRQQGYDAERTDKILAGVYQRYGMAADAAQIYARGERELAEAVERANAAAAARPKTAGGQAPLTGADYSRMAANQNDHTGQGSNFAAANLAYQFQDVAVTASMGMNPLMIALQQGTQIASTFGGMGAAGAVSTLATAFTSLINPVSLAAIALTAAAAAGIQYFSGLFNEGSKAEEKLESHRQKIGEVARQWGDALPALKAYSDAEKERLDREARKSATNEYGEMQWEEARRQLSQLKIEFADFVSQLSASGAELDSIRKIQSEFNGLVQGVQKGTASTEEARRVQSQLLSLYRDTGLPVLKDFAAGFTKIGNEIERASAKARTATQQDAMLDFMKSLKPLGTLNPIVSADGRMIWDAMEQQQARANEAANRDPLVLSNGRYIRPPTPQPRPLFELELDQLQTDRLEIENRRRMMEAEINALRAKSPVEKEIAARAREEANVIDGESDAMRVSRISLAGTRARVEAEYQLAEAQKERVRGLNESVQWQQMEISLLGKTQGEMVALQLAYSMISRVREEAARNNIRVDERELAMIQQKATELGRLADLYARLQLRGELQFERDQLFRSDQDQQIASRLRSSGLAVDLESAEAKMIRENMRISELRSDLKGFFSDFRDGLMQGESFGEALGNAILNALSNSLTRWTDRLFDSAITSLLGGGGSQSGFTLNTTLGAFLGAANDNRMGGYSGLGASQAIATGAQSITGGAVDLAMRMLGQTETANTGSINAFMAAGGVDLDAATSAWCAGFVNSALKQIGVDGTGSSVANSFQNWGQLVNPSDVMRGDVLLQSRGLGASSLGGHVGLATGASRFVGGQQQLQMLSGNYDNSVGLAWINAQELQVRRATEAATSLGRLSDSSGVAMQGLGSLGSGLNQFGATLSRVMGGGTGGFNVSSLFGSLSNAGWNMGILSSSSQVLGAVMKGSWGLWDDGGYTGAGGKHDVAGLVHRGEVVWSQEDVARWGGAGNVDAMRRGLRGYADGGIVGDRRRVVGMPTSSSGGERVRVIETVKEVRIAYDEQGNPYQRMREIAREESDIIASQRADEVRGELPDRMNAWQRNPYKRGA